MSYALPALRIIDGTLIRTAVYRIYDAAGTLLYVGISDRFGRRWTDEAREQPWWPLMKRQTIDWYDTRDLALAAEAVAIKAEKPEHNKIHAGSPRRGHVRNWCRAKRISEFRLETVPRLLQVDPYAEHLPEAQRPRSANAGYQEGQKVLWQGGIQKRFVMLEAALRSPLMPAHPQRCQLDRLLVVAGSADIELGIIPHSVNLRIMADHGFLVADNVVMVETCGTEVEIAGDTAATYDRIFDLLLAEAVTGDEARRLITAAATDLREST